MADLTPVPSADPTAPSPAGPSLCSTMYPAYAPPSARAVELHAALVDFMRDFAARRG